MEFELRKWQLSDAPSIVKYANSSKISDFMSDGFPHPFTIEKAIAFIENSAHNPVNHYFAICVDDEAVGGIGISIQADVHRKNAELGYWLAEPFWGKGLATKSVLAIVEYAFKNCDVIRIFARPFSSNTASHKVLLKAGFKQEAILEKAIVKNGEILDEYVFAIVKTV
jgi:RimJ/RimL family protein N-acetyltransferase